MNLMPVWLCIVAVAALLVAESRGINRLEWLTKPTAAAAFIWAGISWGALDSSYGQWILLGLVLCACGDVLLISKGESRGFMAGIGAFLLGHVAYLLAFLTLDLDMIAALVTGVLMLVAAVFLLRWLLPNVGADFKIPVVVYIVVILLMVVGAAAATFAGNGAAILIGAVAFAVSDISVARNRFIAPGFVNRVWGLPLYFGAQLVIAGTVIGVAA